MSLPNNHSMDSGPEGPPGHHRSRGGAGMQTVGAGADSADAGAPVVVTMRTSTSASLPSTPPV